MGADRAPEPLAIDRCRMELSIGQGLSRSLATQRDVFQLAGKFPLDVDRGAEQ
jgi:hypothetical protein